MGEFDDVSKVEKYVISEDAYNKRDDTFRKFHADQMKHNPLFKEAMEAKKIPADFQKELADLTQPTMRCNLNIGQRRGEIKYVGKVKELGPGYWIGVQLDEPSGDSNGSVKGKAYFEC
jgi:tubulin-folding cofactor B